MNGPLLRADREATGLSRENFYYEHGERLGFSVRTLSRAEQGGPISLRKLRAIATALKTLPERYVLPDSKSPRRSVDLSGEWLSFYLEDDEHTEPYIVSDDVQIAQVGDTLKGKYLPNRSSHPLDYLRETSFVLEGTVVDDMVYGHFAVSGRSGAAGIGCFQMVITKNGEWLDGFCTFYDDQRKITASKHIWTRTSSPHFRMHCNQISQIMEEHRPAYREFNLLGRRR